MAREDQRILGDAFCDVVEQVAFMFGEPAEAVEPCWGRLLVASMEFSGPQEGLVYLAVSWSTGRLFMNNILGTDRAGAFEADIKDAIGEVLNVTCNHFLSQRFGEEAQFGTAFPQVYLAAPGAWSRLRAQPGTTAYHVDSARVLLHLSINQEAS